MRAPSKYVQVLIAVALIGSLEGFGFVPVSDGITLLGVLRGVGYLAFAILTVVSVTATGRVRFGRTPLPIALLIGLSAASIVVDGNPRGWLIRMIVLIGSLSIGWIYQQRGGIDAFLKLLVPILVGAVLVSLLTALFSPANGRNPLGAWTGIFAHKNDLGRVASLMIVVLYMALKRSLLTGRQFLGGMVIGGFVVLMSDSATVLIVLGVLVPTSVAGSLLRRRDVVSDMAVGLATAVILGLAVYLMVGGGDEIFNSLFGALGRDTDGNSLALRRSLWGLALETATEHFWTGQGLSFEDLSGGRELRLDNGTARVLWDAKHAHNSIIDVWLRIGFFGVIASLWLLVWLVVRGFSRARGGDGSILLLGLTVMAMATTYSVLLGRDLLLWIVLSVVVLNARSPDEKVS